LKPQKAQAKRGKMKTRIFMQGSSNPWWLENTSWCLSVFNYSTLHSGYKHTLGTRKKYACNRYMLISEQLKMSLFLLNITY